MKLAIVLLIAACTFAATDAQDKPTQPAPRIIKPLTVPPGAVERETGRFYYTDQQGKKWIYTKTPWGVSRMEDKPVAADAPKRDDFANVKITEDGDVVKFERPGPFGIYKWQKAKSDLDEGEKAALQRSKGSNQGPAANQGSSTNQSSPAKTKSTAKQDK